MCIKTYGYKHVLMFGHFPQHLFQKNCVSVSKHFRDDLILCFFLSHEYRENKSLAKKS